MLVIVSRGLTRQPHQTLKGGQLQRQRGQAKITKDAG
jgi:hypothetical protein